jgi:molybdopterin/thiamine biosynthesis adenylyltransferase
MASSPGHGGAAPEVVVVGAGGNIGSHLVPHLARMGGIAALTLVDPDRYEARNLRAQEISAADVGQAKVCVQARRVRRINPALRVRTVQRPVESVPRGRLRCGLLVTCVDSRRTRQVVNEVALHLGIPWVDAGVEPAAHLARVSCYRPGPDAPCLECAWDDRDYAAVEQRYPCQGEAAPTTATNGSSSLGALAAAHQALACQAVVQGLSTGGRFGRQVLWDALHHKVQVTTFRRRATCRLADHAAWQVWPLDHSARDLSVEGMLGLISTILEEEASWLRVPGSPFVTRLTCTGCGKARGLLHLQVALHPRRLRCGACGAPLVAPGFSLRERLTAADLTPRALRRSLHSIGVRDGEIVAVGGSKGAAHFEIRGEAS